MTNQVPSNLHYFNTLDCDGDHVDDDFLFSSHVHDVAGDALAAVMLSNNLM